MTEITMSTEDYKAVSKFARHIKLDQAGRDLVMATMKELNINQQAYLYVKENVYVWLLMNHPDALTESIPQHTDNRRS